MNSHVRVELVLTGKIELLTGSGSHWMCCLAWACGGSGGGSRYRSPVSVG